MNKLDITTFEQKIGKWMKYLQPFFESKEAWNIYQELKTIAKTEVVSPKASDLWNFLLFSDPENIKVLCIGLEPYPGRYNKNLLHATGISFDCSNSPDGKLQPNLTCLWEGLSAEFEEELPPVGDLKFLLEQGLLLTNAGLSVKLFKTGSMLQLWEPFWRYFFELYVNKRPDIPIIFLGNEAKKLKKYVEFNKTFELQHPSFNVRNGTLWETKGVFKTCNKIIQGLNGNEFVIEYNYDKWKQGIKTISTPPTLEEISEIIDELPF